MDIIHIRQAIISVFNKEGAAELGQVLTEGGARILSTGGTGRALKQAGIAYQEVSEYTGSPEMLQGRVKTLHPKIHGGLLFKREDQYQVVEAEQYGIKPIDLVAVNLYPFAATIAKPGVTIEEATENIDIGGPTMIRAGAKNFASVTVVTDPSDYEVIMSEFKNNGGVCLATRRRLAAKAFEHTSEYDRTIAQYLAK